MICILDGVLLRYELGYVLFLLKLVVLWKCWLWVFGGGVVCGMWENLNLIWFVMFEGDWIWVGGLVLNMEKLGVLGVLKSELLVNVFVVGFWVVLSLGMFVLVLVVGGLDWFLVGFLEVWLCWGVVGGNFGIVRVGCFWVIGDFFFCCVWVSLGCFLEVGDFCVCCVWVSVVWLSMFMVFFVCIGGVCIGFVCIGFVFIGFVCVVLICVDLGCIGFVCIGLVCIVLFVGLVILILIVWIFLFSIIFCGESCGDVFLVIFLFIDFLVGDWGLGLGDWLV